MMDSRLFQLDDSFRHGMSYTNTIMPRLLYSLDVLDGTLRNLKKKQLELQKLNTKYTNYENTDCEKTDFQQLDLEKQISYAVELLEKIQHKLHSIQRIDAIPSILSPIIPILRAVSANLSSVSNEFSINLCNLSINLGSIAMDSATLIGARFDFKETNLESNVLLDEAKLMVDSKINKQYPNLDFIKAENT